MLHDALELCDGPGRHPLVEDGGAVGRPDDEVGSGLRGPQGARGPRRLHPRRRQDARRRRRRPPRRWPPRASRPRCGTCGSSPLDPEMLADAAEHPVVLTVEDGIREGGVGSLIADAVSPRDPQRHAAAVRVLGTPIAYIPHGKPDAILAELGLDAAGLAAEARARRRARPKDACGCASPQPRIARLSRPTARSATSPMRTSTSQFCRRPLAPPSGRTQTRRPSSARRLAVPAWTTCRRGSRRRRGRWCRSRR